MDEVEAIALTEGLEISPHAVGRNLGFQRLQTGQREDGVVKVRATVAVRPAAGLRDLSVQKITHEIGGITQQAWRETGDLEKLQTETHASWSL